MYFKISWDQDFADLMMYLWAKYGRAVFTENGIGDQLDLNKFSKDFFNNNTTTADVSIDANANVSGKTVIDYSFEFPKPLQKYNSHYLFWKQLKTVYGLLEANRIIEKQINGEIYINDFSNGAIPYSYHPNTTIIININGNIKNISMYRLFEELSIMKEVEIDREYIDLREHNITILDKGKWVKLIRILKHKSHTDLVRIETKKGGVCVVTEDHPVILEDGREKQAKDVTLNDFILAESRFLGTEVKSISSEKAYLIGAMVGDGFVSNNRCFFVQNDIKNTNFDKIITDLYDMVSYPKDNRICFGAIAESKEYLRMIGHLAQGKQLPYDFLEWNKEAKISLLSGIIDTDGTINKRSGVISIRMIGYAAIQQIAELAYSIGCDRVRTSLVKKWDSTKSYKGHNKLYNCSFRVKDPLFIEKSIKIKNNVDISYKVAGADGRWETNQVNKIDTVLWKGNDVYDITTETGTFYSNGLTVHNCFNYSTYDIALNGLNMSRRMNIKPPKSLESFIRQMEQFTVYAANSTAGATGLADFLIVSGYYVDRIIDGSFDGHICVESNINSQKKFTDKIKTYVSEKIKSFIYTVNWEFRGNQSPFTNVSVYDRFFLEKLVSDYVFPDGKCPKIETVEKIQKLFVEAMNEELRRSDLTFPVTTACFYVKEGKIKDTEFLDYIADQNLEHGFINIYYGDSSTLSSCCRLRSSTDNEYFNSFGAGSTKIGSLGVVTVNLPRLAYLSENKETFFELIRESVAVVAKINHAKRNIIKKRIELDSMPLYSLGHMDLSKQYSTYGVTGLNEALDILGYDILSEEGETFVMDLLDLINDENDKMSKRFKSPHNCEQVPAESSAVKLAKRDRTLKYQDEYVLYSNQFIPLTKPADMLDRLRLQGKFDSKFSGGAICHVNVGEKIKNKQTMIDLMLYSAKCGVVYWAVNYALKRCINSHVFVDEDICPFCGEGIDHVSTRVVGFFTNVNNWNEVRRNNDWKNRQFYKDLK
jgi:ribonucleoside-triphosphate reductase